MVEYLENTCCQDIAMKNRSSQPRFQILLNQRPHTLPLYETTTYGLGKNPTETNILTDAR